MKQRQRNNKQTNKTNASVKRGWAARECQASWGWDPSGLLSVVGALADPPTMLAPLPLPFADQRTMRCKCASS